VERQQNPRNAETKINLVREADGSWLLPIIWFPLALCSKAVARLRGLM